MVRVEGGISTSGKSSRCFYFNSSIKVSNNIYFNVNILVYSSYRYFIYITDLSGGGALFYLGTYSMYADMNKGQPAKFTTVRLAVVDGLIYLGFYVGNAMAGPVKDNLGLEYNFALGILFAVIAAAYTIIYIKETLVQTEVGTKSEEEQNFEIKKDGEYILNSIFYKR